MVILLIVIIALLVTKNGITSRTGGSSGASSTIRSNTINGTTSIGSGTNASTATTSINASNSSSKSTTSTISGNSSTQYTTTIIGSKTTTITTSAGTSSFYTTSISNGGGGNGSGSAANYTFCVGTQSSYPLNLTYFAPLSNSGIGDWVNTTSYPEPIYGAGCAINGNYIYCVGSSTQASSPTSNSYYAQVSSSGISNWTQTSSYPRSLYNAGCSIYNNYIYCVGGGAYNTSYYSYYAPVSNSGIGAWQATTPYPTGLYDAGCTIYDGYIYCVGDAYYNATRGVIFNVSKIELAYSAPISSKGIGKWTEVTSYPIPFYDSGCSAYDNTLTCVGDGGELGANESSVYYAPITSPGNLGAWKSTTSYPVPFGSAGCVTDNGYIYCVGSSNSNVSESAYYATINQNGVGQWNQTDSYPIQLNGAYCSASGESGGFFS